MTVPHTLHIAAISPWVYWISEYNFATATLLLIRRISPRLGNNCIKLAAISPKKMFKMINERGIVREK